MKAYFIDTPNKKIEEVAYDGSNERIYELLGFGCTEFAAIVSNLQRDILYIDAEARDKIASNAVLRNCRFSHKRYPSVLFGRGVIIGCTDGGDSRPPQHSLESFQQEIKFL